MKRWVVKLEDCFVAFSKVQQQLLDPHSNTIFAASGSVCRQSSARFNMGCADAGCFRLWLYDVIGELTQKLLSRCVHTMQSETKCNVREQHEHL